MDTYDHSLESFGWNVQNIQIQYLWNGNLVEMRDKTASDGKSDMKPEDHSYDPKISKNMIPTA